MKYQVLEVFKVKTSQREMELQPGQVITLPQDKAIRLLNGGKIIPIPNELPEDVKKAYDERAAIMEYDGGLDREEAERQAWCRTACMLSFPSQWGKCERFKPKPCLKLINQNEDRKSKEKMEGKNATETNFFTCKS